MLVISMIYTSSQDGVIGHNNSIPWKANLELARYEGATKNKLLIMGRNTWLSLPVALEPRDIIVISSTPLPDSNVPVVSSLNAALAIATKNKKKEAIIIGGARLFQEAMLVCHVIYKSTLLIDVKGNVYAPIIPAERFKLVWVKNIKGNTAYSYQTFLVKEWEGQKLSPDFGLLLAKVGPK